MVWLGFVVVRAVFDSVAYTPVWGPVNKGAEDSWVLVTPSSRTSNSDYDLTIIMWLWSVTCCSRAMVFS